MASNILLLPQLDGTQTSFTVTNNGDWIDTICFTTPGSVAVPTNMLGLITSSSNTFTVASTIGLIPGMAFSAGPGFPAGGFVGTVLSATQVTLVDSGGNPLNSTISDAELTLTFQPLVLDITGIRFRGHIRPSIGSSVLHLAMDTLTGEFINGGATGLLSFNVLQTRMATLPVATHVFDILALADGYTFNLFPNAPCSVVVSPGVTYIF